MRPTRAREAGAAGPGLDASHRANRALADGSEPMEQLASRTTVRSCAWAYTTTPYAIAAHPPRMLAFVIPPDRSRHPRRLTQASRFPFKANPKTVVRPVCLALYSGRGLQGFRRCVRPSVTCARREAPSHVVRQRLSSQTSSPHDTTSPATLSLTRGRSSPALPALGRTALGRIFSGTGPLRDPPVTPRLATCYGEPRP